MGHCRTVHWTKNHIALFSQFCLALFQIVFAAPEVAWAKFQVELKLIEDRTGAKIEVLEINETRTRATFVEVEEPDKLPVDEDLFRAAKFTVEIYARLTQTEGWNILYNNTLVKTGDAGRFVLRLPLRADEQWFDLSAISDTGTVASQRIGVRVVNIKEFTVYLRERRTPVRIAPTVGAHFLTYRQKNVPDLRTLLAAGGLGSTYDIDSGNIEAHYDVNYLHPIVPPDPKVATISYLKSSAYLSKYLEFEWLPEQIHHFILGGGVFFHYLNVDPRLFGYTMIGGFFGDLLTSFSLGRAYSLDLGLRYGTFPWGGEISGFWSRRMLGANLAFIRTFVTGAKLSFAVDLEQVTVDVGSVALFFGGLSIGYTIQL